MSSQWRKVATVGSFNFDKLIKIKDIRLAVGGGLKSLYVNTSYRITIKYKHFQIVICKRAIVKDSDDTEIINFV